MPIYSKTAKQQLVDLINEGNPDLPFALNVTDYDFTDPSSITPTPEGHNTQIRVIAKTTAPYTGNVLLTYRRLDLGKLFEGIVPTVRKWVENSGSTTSYDHLIYLYEILPLFTKKYGVLLEESEIQNENLRERHGNNPDDYHWYLRAKSTSILFVGNTRAEWHIGERELWDLLQVDEVEGRQYPESNDFTAPENRKPYLTPNTFDTDFTLFHQDNPRLDYTTYYMWYNSSTYHRMQNNAITQLLNDHVAPAVGFNFIEAGEDGYNTMYNSGSGFSTHPASEGKAYTRGLYYNTYSLPDARVPEANSEFYNRVVVLEIPEDCPWGSGNLYFHFNI